MSYDEYQQEKPVVVVEKKPKVSGWRIFWRIVLTLSILINGFFLLLIIGLAAVLAMSQGDIFDARNIFAERVVREGDIGNKIVVMRIEGIIDGKQCEQVRKQLKAAREDETVKALIVRMITPGGGVASSDRIHHYITKFRKETQKPIVAFMQTVAASGGYYTSVACDKIVAEPTVITGSIGVMLNHLVVRELFEDKLGIVPVVVKSGARKDWPSIFSETTDEQKQYLQEKLITPAYERFVRLVYEGRSMLDESQVRQLADGSIYGAEEAFEKNLIDGIGYIEKAIAVTEQMAGIKDAYVVEYERPFSLATFLESESKSLWQIDVDTVHEMATPKLMYLWNGSW